MKPTAVVLVFALGAWAGGAPAAAQSPWQVAAPLKPSPEAVGDHWEACPAPWEPHVLPHIPDAFLWADYRGAYIEHDLYRPRYLTPPVGGAECSRPVLSGIGAWLDGLVAWMPFHRSQCCYHCGPQAISHGQTETMSLPPANDAYVPPVHEPLLAPVPLPDHEPRLTPVQPRVVAPTPINPAPIEPVPIERAPPPPAIVRPVPIQPMPAQPAPVWPAPVQPAPAPHVEVDRLPTNLIPPRVEPALPPATVIPPRLIPPRSPVVELAPEPALPIEPQAAPPTVPAEKPLPRNRVPRPGEQLPRNGIPR